MTLSSDTSVLLRMLAGEGVNAAFGWWSFERSTRVVECARPLIEQIGAAAREGFMRFPHGGVEIGGVLFGVRQGGRVRIVASRPLTIEYARGPSFALSDADEATLRQLIANAGKDPGLKGLQVAGWYQSHTRRDLTLSERDLALFDRHFAEPWHVCMVFKPEQQNPTRITVYVRADDGALLEASAYSETKLDDIPTVEAPPAPEAAPPQVRAVEPPARPVEAPIFREPPRPSSPRRYWIAALVLAACAGLAVWLLRAPSPRPVTEHMNAAPEPAPSPTPAVTPSKAPEQNVAPAKPAPVSKHSRGKRGRRHRARSRRPEE